MGATGSVIVTLLLLPVVMVQQMLTFRWRRLHYRRPRNVVEVAHRIDRALGLASPPMTSAEWDAFLEGTGGYADWDSEKATDLVNALLDNYRPLGLDTPGIPPDAEGKQLLANLAEMIRSGPGKEAARPALKLVE